MDEGMTLLNSTELNYTRDVEKNEHQINVSVMCAWNTLCTYKQTQWQHKEPNYYYCFDKVKICESFSVFLLSS